MYEDNYTDDGWEEFIRNHDIACITNNLDITSRYVDNKRDLQEYYESEDDTGTFAEFHKRFPGMVVTMCGGTVPWQAEGFIGDYVFYLRARHGVLSLKIYNMLISLRLLSRFIRKILIMVCFWDMERCYMLVHVN